MRPSATFTGLALDPTIQTIIDGEPEQIGREEIAAKLNEVLPDLLHSLENTATDQYTQLALAAVSGTLAANSARPFELAIVSFRCTRCSEKAMRWPAVIRHKCLLAEAIHGGYGDQYRQQLTEFVRKMPSASLDKGRLSPRDCLEFAPGLIYAREIVSMCGFNPDIATREELDTCGVRLRCKMCATLSKQEIFGWRDAVSHLYHLRKTILG